MSGIVDEQQAVEPIASLPNLLKQLFKKDASLEEELAQLKQALDRFICDGDVFAPAESAVWRKAKRAAASETTESTGDVTVGKNLPQPPTRLIGNNIGGALPL